MTDKCLKTHQRPTGKASKHILERQRRARINQSLAELKNLVLSSLYHDNPEVYMDKSRERLDKAEILDLTVNFLKHHITGTRMESFERTGRETVLSRDQFVEDPRFVSHTVCPGCADGRCSMAYGPYGVSTPPPSPPHAQVFFAGRGVHHYAIPQYTAAPSSEIAKIVKKEPTECNETSSVWRPW
ncbi:predicted protein [Nematostella vectensis]|uniref:Transcription cofactor HES-6 n=1 Tax=Nematostella vectensis TaxID=45351 RepID=A7S155_NEMVE|nr:transcription factor HES-1 [Nematostella vectensis]EDO42537.1 predicted protein [Nematostella vectensis]|eukprot:XP_001634600.1 predicted protein [Nematostella vectensis]